MKSAVLGVGGGDEVERHMGGPADVFVREAAGRALVPTTDHTLTDEVGPADHEHQQDDGDDQAYGARAGGRDPTGGGRDEVAVKFV